ncbi:hypothetical protein LTR95_007810 [Oleoguttula sp. CCFEE 5521]
MDSKESKQISTLARRFLRQQSSSTSSPNKKPPRQLNEPPEVYGRVVTPPPGPGDGLWNLDEEGYREMNLNPLPKNSRTPACYVAL